MVRAMQRWEALDLFPVGALLKLRPSGIVGLRLATGFGSQAVWNRSKRRGGARVGKPRRVRILTITAGSSIAAIIFKAPPQFDLG